MEATVTIEKVFTRQGQSNKGPWTAYNIKGTDGKTYSTFDNGQGSLAQSLEGQQAIITYEVKQNGEYQNNEVSNLVAAAGQAPAPAPQQQVSKDMSICLAYGKDIAVALIRQGTITTEQQAIDTAIRIGTQFHAHLTGKEVTDFEEVDFSGPLT